MKWPFGKTAGEEGELDIDGYVKEITMGTGKLPEEENYAYLKSIRVSGEPDLEKVIKELKKGNMVVMSIGGLFSDKGRLRAVIERVKAQVSELRGDLCKVSNEKILLVPEGMEIVA
jgi:SepF-like predicted cell division protein (DUF552 family)